jgi:hypothetical protein
MNLSYSYRPLFLFFIPKAGANVKPFFQFNKNYFHLFLPYLFLSYYYTLNELPLFYLTSFASANLQPFTIPYKPFLNLFLKKYTRFR